MKTRPRPLLVALLGSALLNWQCQKDAALNEMGIALLEASSVITVIGKVTNENGEPVAGGTIYSINNKVTADNKGQFTITTSAADQASIPVWAEQKGYFPGIRTFTNNSQDTQYVKISLLPKKSVGSFESGKGGTVSLLQQIKVDFAANSIVNAADYKPYQGKVLVAAAYIDPTARNFQETMPGELKGIDAGNRLMGLQSFGMVGVEMTGSDGQKLQIAPGKTATLHIGIPTGLRQEAPATIPYWHFDENAGIWKEEGYAISNGSWYTGKVTHFSFWNADYPYPVVQLKVALLTKGLKFNIPIANYKVVIKAAGDPVSTYGYGYTDATGLVAGNVPANRSLEIYVHDYCGNAYLVATVKAGSADIDLGEVVVKNWLGLREDNSGQPVDCIN